MPSLACYYLIMKILKNILLLIAFIFIFNSNTSYALAIPCIESPGIECPPGNSTYPRWDNKSPTFTDQLQDPTKFLFLVIPISLIIIFTFLIYFKNQKEKNLNIERIKLSFLNQLFFLIIALIGYGIYLIASSYLLSDYYNKNYSGRYTDSSYKTLKEISSFSFPIASLLIAHYITLFLRKRMHYIITSIVILLMIGTFYLFNTVL